MIAQRVAIPSRAETMAMRGLSQAGSNEERRALLLRGRASLKPNAIDAALSMMSMAEA
jgi:hypothetical protein